jgi:hypothetical protein
MIYKTFLKLREQTLQLRERIAQLRKVGTLRIAARR